MALPTEKKPKDDSGREPKKDSVSLDDLLDKDGGFRLSDEKRTGEPARMMTESSYDRRRHAELGGRERNPFVSSDGPDDGAVRSIRQLSPIEVDRMRAADAGEKRRRARIAAASSEHVADAAPVAEPDKTINQSDDSDSMVDAVDAAFNPNAGEAPHDDRTASQGILVTAIEAVWYMLIPMVFGISVASGLGLRAGVMIAAVMALVFPVVAGVRAVVSLATGRGGSAWAIAGLIISLISLVVVVMMYIRAEGLISDISNALSNLANSTSALDSLKS